MFEENYLGKMCDFDVFLFEKLCSTNSFLKENKSIFTNNTLIIAKTQSKGKGNFDRTFFSPLGGLYCSFLFKTPLPLTYQKYITPFSAVATSRAICRLTGKNVGIKWVNDLYFDNKKLCGILSESTILDKELFDIIIGIGINVNTTTFSSELNNATSLKLCFDKDYSIPTLTNYLIEEMSKMPKEITKNDFFDYYISNSILIGNSVSTPNGDGICKSINKDCSITILINGKDKTFFVGDIFVKPKI